MRRGHSVVGMCPIDAPLDPLDWKTYGLALGQRVREVREAVGMTQEELWLRSGLSRAQVQNIERSRSARGGPGNPRLGTVYRIAQALRVPVIALLPSIGSVPPVTAREVTVDLAVTGIPVELEHFVHEARQVLAEERSR